MDYFPYSPYVSLSLCLSFCSYSYLFTLSKTLEWLILKWTNDRSGLLGATFFEDLLRLGQIPFHCYYRGVLNPPQGFHCKV